MQAFYIKQDTKRTRKHQKELIPNVPIVLKMYLIIPYIIPYTTTKQIL